MRTLGRRRQSLRSSLPSNPPCCCELLFRAKGKNIFFFPQHGGPFLGQVGGQRGKGIPGHPPLLSCSWFSLLGVHLRAPQRPPSGRRPWGSGRPATAMVTPAQTPPGPSQRRALYQLYPGRARHPGSLCWALGRYSPLKGRR